MIYGSHGSIANACPQAVPSELKLPWAFIGRCFTSGGEESGCVCVFSAVVYKIQARKRYIESLPPVLKD